MRGLKSYIHRRFQYFTGGGGVKCEMSSEKSTAKFNSNILLPFVYRPIFTDRSHIPCFRKIDQEKKKIPNVHKKRKETQKFKRKTVDLNGQPHQLRCHISNSNKNRTLIRGKQRTKLHNSR